MIDNVCLLTIDDGREDYLEQAMESVQEHLPLVRWTVHVDDSDHALGFAGAIAKGWQEIRRRTEAEWVFHLESDFLLCRPVQLRQMIRLLEDHPHLAQVSLKRQPVNERELAAGGIVEADAADFSECFDGSFTWTEHRRYWTTNPSVYSASWCGKGWPQVPESEGVFTHSLISDPDLRFAIWGGKYEPPRVEHIGRVRAGVGY